MPAFTRTITYQKYWKNNRLTTSLWAYPTMACYASIHFSTLCIFNIDTRQQSLTANPESEQLTTWNLVRFMLCTHVPLSPLPPDYNRSDKIDVIVHPIPQTLKSPQRIVPATKIITFFSPFLNCRLNDRLIEVFESLRGGSQNGSLRSFQISSATR